MIQRIQTLYLAIVFLLSILLYFLPVSTKIIPASTTGEIIYKINLHDIEKYENGLKTSSSSNFLLLILNTGIGLLSAAIIFLYRKRLKQLMLCRICILLVCIFLIIDFYLSDSAGKEFGSDFKAVYMAGSYFPIIQIILLIITMRAIKKDEELVRSADRIR